MFPAVNPKIRFPELEKEILDFWRKEKIFQRSIDPAFAKASAGKHQKTSFTFYDGPPFATGLPHYGHILAGVIKDVIPRYQTMRGHRVERRFGWDCHGLPIENIKEKELGISGKKQIEEYGIAKFNEDCRSIVMRYAHDWRALVERTGRWVDMDNDYKTMDASYMESVWWVFKQLWDKGFVYEGFKAMQICPRCTTPLSNFEVSQGYKDVTDWSVIAKFPITDTAFLGKYGNEKRTSFIAWTTTPWSVPTTMGLAIGREFDYVILSVADEQVVCAEARVEYVTKGLEEGGWNVVAKLRGSDIEGISYEHPFGTVYAKHPQVEGNTNVYKTYATDYVSVEDGTGIVTINGAFGEIDMEAARRFELPIVINVRMDGTYDDTMAPVDLANESVKPVDDPTKTDQKIAAYLETTGFLFRKETYRHSYPHCWRCDHPLLNYATKSWFISVTKLKENLLKNNAQTHWVPETMRDGRFGKWLENARDWAVSRNRYWGAPLPVWRCGACEKTEAIGSMEDLFARIPERITKLVLVRHAHSMKQELRINSSTNDIDLPLTEKGRGQVDSLIQALSAMNVDAVYSSPAQRAKDTLAPLGKDILEDERLGESQKGIFEGVSKDDPSYRAFMEHHFALPIEQRWENPYEGGESEADMARRVEFFLSENILGKPGRTAVIVSHSAILRHIIRAVRGMETEEFYRKRDLLTIKTGDSLTLYIDTQTGREFDLHKHIVDELSWKCECGGSSGKGKVFFVRHGRSEKNVQNIASRSVEDIFPLTEEGEQQAREVAEGLKSKGISRIIASRVFRTRQTAEIIASILSVPIEYDDRLLETDQGELEGVSCDSEPYRKAVEASCQDAALPYPGGESYEDMRSRVHAAYEDILLKYPNENVIIVSHGDPLYVLEQSLKGIFPVDWSREAIKKVYPKYATAYELPSPTGTMRRVPEVLDCWFESGSMPYAQEHYPFENKKRFEANFPANFIAEGQDQTRGWFYTLMVLSTALFDKPAFQNVIVNGIVLAEDGKKMSKKLKNYPDPAIVMEQYGADAMRWYLMASPAVSANDLRFSEKGVDEVVKSVLLPLWNAYSFFVMYANIDGWQPKEDEGYRIKDGSSQLTSSILHLASNPLDAWILSELQVCITRMTVALDGYDLAEATKPVLDFIDGLTNWYIRRSRRRFWKSENDGDKAEAYATLYRVLTTLTQLTAPFVPFISEEIYRGLLSPFEKGSTPSGNEGGGISVHLTDWPTADQALVNENLNQEISLIHTVVSLGLSLRGMKKMKVRQPLSKVEIALSDTQKSTVSAYADIVKEELNVKEIVFVDDATSIARIIARPNGKLIGPKFGGEVQDIIRAAKEGKFREEGGNVIVEGDGGKEWSLTQEEVEIAYAGKEGHEVASDRGVVLSLDFTVTPELEREGIARELIRTIQDLRKEADYGVSDRILIGLTGVNDQVEKEWGSYIERETLGTITRDILEWDKEAALPECETVGVKRV